MRASNHQGQPLGSVRGRDIPLRPLLTFEVVARHRSFRDAARELHVSAGAVSRQMRQLEEFMGKPLFVRLQSGVELTSFGCTLLPSVRQAVRELESGAERVRSAQAVVRVSLLPVFAMQWLAPRLSELRRALRGIEIQLRLENSLVDLQDGGCDLAIRGLPLGASSQLPAAQPLLQGNFVAVCAPQLLPAGRRPISLRQLHRYDWLESEDFAPWARCREVCPELCHDARILFVPDCMLAVQAARAGQGITICNEDLVRADVERGVLAYATEQRFSLNAGVYAVCSPHALQRSEVEAVRAWFIAQSPLAQ
jgi:LysR family transcriptional regulator, glycine cleavage system transcriptional activator